MKPNFGRSELLTLLFLLFLVSFVLEKGFGLHAGFKVVAIAFLAMLTYVLTSAAVLPGPFGWRKALGYVIAASVVAIVFGSVGQVLAPPRFDSVSRILIKTGIFCIVPPLIFVCATLFIGAVRRK